MRVYLILVVISMVPCFASLAQTSQPQASAADLPPGEGRDLVLNHCVACHGIERVTHAGGTQAGWAGRIRRMVRWGAKIPPNDATRMAIFLGGVLPPRPGAATSSSLALNTTVSVTSKHPVQSIVRTAGSSDGRGETLTANLSIANPQDVAVGQRARVFAANARLSAHQARVSRIWNEAGRLKVEARLTGGVLERAMDYVLEIIVEHGELLSVPNEAIIESDQRRWVYVQSRSGSYQPRDIEVGVQGERYTQILSGLEPGAAVVTLGGFFIDAEYRMKSGN